jgi:beta-glucosidase
MLNVMRGEWKYQGLIIDDALTGSNTDQYSNGPAMIHCGTDLFCLDGNRGSQLKQWVTSNNDGQILKDMQRANKYVLYAMSRSWLGGVTPENVGAAPWWKITVDALTISAGVVTVGLFGMYVFTEIISKRKAAKPADAE